MIREQAHDYLQGSGFGEGQIKAIESAFVNSALEDIKAEIKEYKHGNGNMFACGLNKAVEIIDKHISGKENDTWQD